MMSPVSKGASIENTIYQMLMKTFILLDDCDNRFFAEYGLSARQFWTLQHLDEVNGRSMIDLSRLLFTDKSNVTGIIDRLEGQNLVNRATSPRDRRVTLITLTVEGSRLREKIKGPHDQRIHELISVLDHAKLQALFESLQEVCHNIEMHLQQPYSASVT